MKPNPVHGALFGVAIGDALGVPVEMIKRDVLKLDPVKDFANYKGPEVIKAIINHWALSPMIAPLRFAWLSHYAMGIT
jgi:ADP-ribosylglycohydrolase